MPNLNYGYPHPPIDLIKTHLECEKIRSDVDIPGNRIDKRLIYSKVRNMLMDEGLKNVKYIGLTSIYPDDILISLYPVVKEITGVEKENKSYIKIKKLVDYWNKNNSAKITIKKENILKADLSGYRVIDLDFNGNINWEDMEAIIDLVNKVDTDLKFGLMIWCSYGMKNNTTKQQIDVLNVLEEELQESFDIINSLECSYVGNKLPMLHRTFILERR